MLAISLMLMSVHKIIIIIGQVQRLLSVAETPNLHDGNPLPKRPRFESPLLFGQPDCSSVPVSSGLHISQETKKLVVSTCRSIVKLEASIRKAGV